MKKIKMLLKYTILSLIFVLIFYFLTILFVKKGNGYGTDVLNFYNQDRDSLDILYLGSSHAYSAFDPYLIEDNTGLKGYVFATQQQPIWITYYYLREALKYQKPKYVVVEVHMLVAQNNDYSEEQVNRDAIDKMKISLNKIDAIVNSVENKSDRLSYYLNIIKYHSRYKSLDDNDWNTIFKNYTVDNKGYIGLPENDYVFDYNIGSVDGEISILKKNMIFLNKIIDLSIENDIQLIFVKTPAYYDKDDLKRLNYLSSYLISRKIELVNYIDDIDTLNLNYETDFFDSGHLNKNGSFKLSNDFSNRLIN